MEQNPIGDLDTFHTHIYMLAADGAFRPECASVSLPPVDHGRRLGAVRDDIRRFER